MPVMRMAVMDRMFLFVFMLPCLLVANTVNYKVRVLR